MIVSRFVKNPNSKLDYSLNWDDWLGANTITASSWAPSVPVGLTEHSDGFAGDVTTVRVSGGTSGQNYKLINSITASNGEQEERSILVKVR